MTILYVIIGKIFCISLEEMTLNTTQRLTTYHIDLNNFILQRPQQQSIGRPVPPSDVRQIPSRGTARP